MSHEPAVVADQPHHYERLRLDPARIEPWEDGLRTDPAARSFEWWYYDCRFDDGSRLTVELHTKPPGASPKLPLTPFVSIVLLRADGTLIVRNAVVPAGEFAAARDRCDVRMGANRCRGDLARHEVHVELDGLAIDLDLTATLAPWRPATGHTLFGADEQRVLAWLPVMPRARVTASFTTDGRVEHLTGTGYHDHNWGTAAPASMVDHWYWGHAHLGAYTFVAVRVVAQARYGKRVIPAMLLARGADVLAAGVGGFELSLADEVVEPRTGVHLANRLVYDIATKDGPCRVTFERRRDVLALPLGPGSGYLRFVGDARLEHAGATVAADGLWECLSFAPR